jgi:hypothetical protein
MPRLGTLTLHSASPFRGVGRTVTLPSLTRLDVLADPGDCALPLAHLDLPALTWLRITAILSHHLDNRDLRKLLPHIARHAHGPQDIQALQSVLLLGAGNRAEIFAWPMPMMPDDVEVHNPSTLPAMTRVALSFTTDHSLISDERLEVFDTVMAGLPRATLSRL